MEETDITVVLTLKKSEVYDIIGSMECHLYDRGTGGDGEIKLQKLIDKIRSQMEEQWNQAQEAKQ